MFEISTEALAINFIQMYRKEGVRLPSHLEKPRIENIVNFVFPKESIWDYLPTSGYDKGPSENDPLLLVVPNLIYIEHADHLTVRVGNPHNKTFERDLAITDFRRTHRRFKPSLKRETSLQDPRNILIHNLALSDKHLTYPENKYTRYYKWYNLRSKLIEDINIDNSGREHFVQIFLPKFIPSLDKFKIAEIKRTAESIKEFNTDSSFDILDLYTFCSKDEIREHSIFAKCNKLDKLNFIITHYDKFILLNAGTLNGWRWTESNKVGLDPHTLQVHFLHMIVTLFETATVTSITEDDKEKVEIAEHHEIGAVEERHLIHSQLTEIAAKPLDAKIASLNVERGETIIKEDNRVLMTDDDGNIVEDEDHPPMDGTFDLIIKNKGINPFEAKANALYERGLISPVEHNRIKELAKSSGNIKDPYGSGLSLKEASIVTPEDIIIEKSVIRDNPRVKDKSHLQEVVKKLDSQYIDKVYKKDILRVVLSFERYGVAITDYRIDKTFNLVSNYEVHSVQLTPAVGKQSTIKFMVPVLDPNTGSFMSNGTKYRLRRQKSDIPIRKINGDRVSISSYSDKLFINRSDKSVNNFQKWFTSQLSAKGFTDGSGITEYEMSNIDTEQYDLPYLYSILSEKTSSFKCKGFKFYFNYPQRTIKGPFTKEDLKHESNRRVLVAKSDKEILLLDKDSNLYNEKGDLFGPLTLFLDIDTLRAPVEYAALAIYGKDIPLGVALGYLYGLDELISMLKEHVRRVPVGLATDLKENEYPVRFLDETYIFRKDSPHAMIFAGFTGYKNAIRHYTSSSFNSPEIYSNVLDDSKLNSRFLKEITAADKGFVDPITEDILRDMGAPTEFVPLLIKATELLSNKYVPKHNTNSKNSMVEGLERIKGYERIPGAIFKELTKSFKSYNNKIPTANSVISHNPYAVWTSIVQDPAAAIVNEINPIENRKEKEVMTYGGNGGRSRRSMMAKDRLYTDEDRGITSEATVDSGDVAIITYMSPNANVTSVYGTTRLLKEGDGTSCMLSTNALIMPSIDRDDPKRAAFSAIQASHIIPTVGYRPSPVRTGLEETLAHGVDDLFAHVAKQDGTVTALTPTSIELTYADNTKEYVELGKRFGISAGMTIPQVVKSNLKLNDKFKVGDITSYNESFFEPSIHDQTQVVWKAGVLARVCLAEGAYTIEDSSALTPTFAKRLGSEVTKTPWITLDFDQNITHMVGVGDHVDLDTILAVIEDDLFSDDKFFTEDSSDLLSKMSKMTPRAKTVGVIDKIEVVYNGDKEMMSDSLQELVARYDKERIRQSKRMGKEPLTGSVDQSQRINGAGLERNKVAIKFYISHLVGMDIGDKIIIGNQMKSVLGYIITGTYETEDGEELDVFFGSTSAINRILRSHDINGTTATLLRVIGEYSADYLLNDNSIYAKFF